MDTVDVEEYFGDSSARFRYRVPLRVIRDLSYDGSKYSPQFELAGYMWRLHLQQRTPPKAEEPFLAVHLQCCSAASIHAHFQLSLRNAEPSATKSKTFHCHFKKAGSAWGLHQFISMQRLLRKENGFIVVSNSGSFIEIEVTINVLDGEGNEDGRESVAAQSMRSLSPSQQQQQQRNFRSPMNTGGRNNAGGYAGLDSPSVPQQQQRGQRPMHSEISMLGVSGERSRSPGDGRIGGGRDLSPRTGTNYNMPLAGGPLTLLDNGSSPNAQQQQQQQQQPQQQQSRAPLMFPYEHLEALCDMWFDVQGVRVKAHRCVVVTRMRPLLPEAMLPLQAGSIVAIAVPMDVFMSFLRYVYTEEYPERGVLPADALLDLYLLSSACEFYDLCAVCLNLVRPILTVENILPIVLTRYNAADDVLTSLYLRVLLDNYDALIQEPQFEEIPGHLFRRLSLIMRNKERVPVVGLPPSKHTLGKQLAWLAESGDYSDVDIVVGDPRYVIKAHRFILASRCILFSQAFHPRDPAPLPSLATPEFNFSQRAWSKLLAAIYRHQLEGHREISAEDIAIVFKMNNVFGMDNQLKKEADQSITNQNALRLLIYAVKHQVLELHERAISYVASNFASLIHNDPQAWDVISELPQYAVVALFRTVVESSNRQ